MADPISTRQFQKVLAEDGGMSGLKEKMDQYYKSREPLFQGDPAKQGILKRGANQAQDLIRKAKGLDVDPLDLQPEELERVLRVERGAREEVTFNVQLLPEWFKVADWVLTPSTPEDQAKKETAAKKIQKDVAVFYNKNKLEFDTPSALKFDEKDFKLAVTKVDTKLAEQLLYSIDIRPERIKEILDQGEKTQHDPGGAQEGEEDNLKLSIPVTDLGFGTDPVEIKKAKNSLKAALTDLQRSNKTAALGVENRQLMFQFNGHTDTLFRILRSMAGLSDSNIRSLIDNRFTKNYVRK